MEASFDFEKAGQRVKFDERDDFMCRYEITDLAEKANLKEKAAGWFHRKWWVPKVACDVIKK